MDSAKKSELREVVHSLQAAEENFDRELKRVAAIAEERREKVRQLREELLGLRMEVTRCSTERRRAMLSQDSQGALSASVYQRTLVERIAKLERDLGGSQNELTRAEARQQQVTLEAAQAPKGADGATKEG